MRRLLPAIVTLSLSAAAHGGTCCHTPTIWTFKNLDTVPVTLTCTLEKSAAWKAEPVTMTTGKIAPLHSFTHKWGSEWYADGMGMIPGTWSCKPEQLEKGETLTFATDWGENVTISWQKSKGSVARK